MEAEPTTENVLLSEFFQAATWDTTEPFRPQFSVGKVIKVYDGDTVTVAACPEGQLHNHIFRFSVRLFGIDAPEVRGATHKLGIASRDALRKLAMGRMVKVRIHHDHRDKYGRLLCDLWMVDGNVHVNSFMLTNGWARSYDKNKSREFLSSESSQHCCVLL